MLLVVLPVSDLCLKNYEQQKEREKWKLPVGDKTSSNLQNQSQHPKTKQRKVYLCAELRFKA